MAFIRVEKKPSGSYMRIVCSQRTSAGKVLQKTLFNLGKVENYSPDQLRRMAEKLLQLSGCPLEEFEKLQCNEIGRYNYGYILFINALIKKYGLDKMIKRKLKQRKIQFDFFAALRLMIVERINDPCSKRSNYFHQQEYLGIDQLDLQHLYRALDILDELSDPLQYFIYRKQVNLFSLSLDLVFYDVTTFYFDSEMEEEGALRQKGFSKDHKPHKTQVVLGLLVDKLRQPIGYELFEGSVYEGNTFETALKKLKEKYNIDKVIVVADRGMLSKANIEKLREHQMDYIIGERLRHLPLQIRQEFLDKSKYTTLELDEQIKIEYQMKQYEDRIIISTWSKQRAIKDQADRERQIKKAKRYIENPSSYNSGVKRGNRKYIKVEQRGLSLDEDLIRENELYDGFIAISTNIKQPDAREVLDQYKHLYQIEHAFRTFKSFLRVRPMFHWTNKRIRGHMCLCYLSYVLLQRLRQLLANKSIKMSENQIRNMLDKMQVSEVEQKASPENIYLRARLSEQSEQAMKALELKILPTTFRKSHIISYLQ